MVNKLTSIRCPGTKPHRKRSGDMIVTEKNCNTLLSFVNSKVENSEGAIKCRDCKNIIHYTTLDGVLNLKVYPPNTRVKLDEGKVVVDGS